MLRSKREIQRRNSSILAAVAVLLVLAAAAAYYWYEAQPPPSAHEAPVKGSTAVPVLTNPAAPIVAAAPTVPRPSVSAASQVMPKPTLRKGKPKKAKPVSQAEERQWHWNVAPYAASQEEVCRKAPEAIDGFNLSPEAKQYFKQTLGTDCKGGTVVWLTPNVLLEQMWSGPDARHKGAHLMNHAAVEELPVTKSSDGRPYRKGAVAETAKALQWTFTQKGKTEVLYLPFVCFNLAWAFAPVPLPDKCVELVFNASIGGHVRWGVGTLAGRSLLSDECNAQKQDDGQWVSWYGECDICTPAIDYIRKTMGDTAKVLQKFLYPVTATKQTLRFSTEVWTNLVYICLEDAAGRQTCGVYIRPEDWKGRYRVEIPDALFLDLENCPK